MRFLSALALWVLPVLALVLVPAPALAQAAASLVADRVFVPAGGQSLVAEGNVEVFFEGTRLTAGRITFDASADRLSIEGPIFIEGADGTLFTADAASLDPQLRNGLLRGARLVLDQQLQLAANQIDRVDGRYTQLYQVAATSCHICAEGDAPLWEIRARRVIHDEAERQLYFDDASFRVAGLPIFYIPRMRLPDPTLARATGLLIPRVSSTDALGIGIKLPYFIKLGDHRDLTLTPYLSSVTTTLEGRYRQAYANGDLRVEAAVTQDDLIADARGYIFADGIFDLGHDIKLRFDIEAASDNAYLLEYGYSDKDRLDSQITLDRVRDRDLGRTTFTYYDSLRDSEDSATLPPYLLDVSRERRLTRWGGTLTLTTDLQGHYRDIGTDVDGRDVARFGVGADWRGTHVTDAGLVVENRLGTQLDYYAVRDDSAIGDSFRTTLYTAATLRYPMLRRTARASHVLEPVLNLAWSQVDGDPVRNEDSTATEFDQANLYALSRFAGEDAVETGLRGAAGLTWTRLGAQGWDSTLTVGRLFRAERDPVFSSTSGLGETLSDWLLAGQIRTPTGLSLDSRVIFDDRLGVTKSETRALWSGDKLDLATSYIFLPADLAEVRPSSVSEWTIDADYRFNDTWSAGFDARYDVTTSDPTRAGLDVGWQNECVTVDFSVSRRFTSSTTVDPSTDFGLAIELNGFSAGRTVDGPTHRCTN
ncbi:LPS-assembly protein LptD [Thalassorhabdomicrobium marinisediminis]|uniref:LPS-assembly protein LptD n=1 Tax=Thalassorhabdomicrobium marinisediminis TaxID=2170577 RepID=A0A2T7G119_9RHOB|nr:LPS assembly protein LptD [Thalassorhabdomicrobium marinisediminis]PVA08126.1 LPS-assembly protein LptD [Thalassorhabdomicrobium marinisediminis]